MSSIIIDTSASRGVTELLRYLLKSGRIDAALTMRNNPENNTYDLGLITDASNLDEAVPLVPVMTVNTGQVLSSISSSRKKMAVVLKPCELRAFTELVKREKGSFENLLTISYTCGGVFPLDLVVKEQIEELLPKYKKTIMNGEIPVNTRDTCRACEHFIPMNADITVSVIGECVPGEGCVMYLNTERAEEFTEGFAGERNDQKLDPSDLKKTLDARLAGKADLFASNAGAGLDQVLDTFGKCVGCHGCSSVCPICYCLLCDFESANFDYNLPYFEEHLSRKGALRLPPDTVFFHLGRLTHMSFSCVGCGMCSDVCPVDIPVASVFKKTGEKTASLFDYLPGRDVEESIPVMVFKEEEFPDIG
ncbi:MAG: Coenzyme F420 hydrogenase/dehydrogenase, beta subunit C-terminal domain [Candidatus Fermentibacteria bacterium]